MTKIYIYCLFDKFDNFLGVYSSLKAVHRDALRICNQGVSHVYIKNVGGSAIANLAMLRNKLKGLCDVEVVYFSDNQYVKIYKTKLKE